MEKNEPLIITEKQPFSNTEAIEPRSEDSQGFIRQNAEHSQDFIKRNIEVSNDSRDRMWEKARGRKSLRNLLTVSLGVSVGSVCARVCMWVHMPVCAEARGGRRLC